MNKFIFKLIRLLVELIGIILEFADIIANNLKDLF